MATIPQARPSAKPYAHEPLQALLRRTATRLPEKVAVIDGDRRFTFRQLDDLSDRFAGALLGKGILKGDRVGLLAPNCAEFVITFFGILKAGGVVTTVNSGYREREIAHQLANAGARMLVAHHDLMGLADTARGDIPSLGPMVPIDPDSSMPGSFWDLIEHAQVLSDPVEIDPVNDLAALPYSSGTTGLTKGVMLTHFNLASNVQQLLHRPGEGAGKRADDVVLVHLPLFHIYGMNVLMNPCIELGATQVMMGRFDMELFLGMLARHRVTYLYTVPPVALALTQYPGIHDYDLSALRVAMVGAAPFSEELQLRVEETAGFPVLQGYGLTESSPFANADFIEFERRRPGSVGPPAADTEEKVVDLETGTREVPRGEAGELLIRGPQVMKGYFNNPEATGETVTGDGWLRTGDIVRRDADGYVWVLDRKKELIKYKGFQVPPAELEGLLLQHAAVADVAVIGKADFEAGEVPKAFVVPKPASGLTGEALMEFIGGKVASFKQVRDVEFVDAIPKNPSGKILRRVLVEQERAKGANPSFRA